MKKPTPCPICGWDYEPTYTVGIIIRTADKTWIRGCLNCTARITAAINTELGPILGISYLDLIILEGSRLKRLTIDA